PSAQEYLTSLGVVTSPEDHSNSLSMAKHNIDKLCVQGRMEYLDVEDGPEVQDLIYSKVSEVLAEEGQVGGDYQLPDTKAAKGHKHINPAVFMSDQRNLNIGNRLSNSANAGPSYQPLTQVFSEISRLKHDQQDSFHQTNKTSNGSPPKQTTKPPTPTKLPL